MNSTLKPFPGLRSLYWIEPMVRGAVTLIILGLMLAVGIWWVIKPFPNAPAPVHPSMTAVYAPWLSAGGAVLAALAGAFVMVRYLLVKKIFCHGTAIKGTVEEVDRHDTNMHSNSSRMNTAATYVHYVTLRYDVHGDDQKVRLRLPHSPSTYDLKKGGEVDLFVLDSLPHKPLIREVYLGRYARR